MSEFTTPLGCRVTVTEAHPSLGDGVILGYRMTPPDDRWAEVFLDQESIDRLMQALGVPTAEAISALVDRLEERGSVLVEIAGITHDIRAHLDEFDRPFLTLDSLRQLLEAVR